MITANADSSELEPAPQLIRGYPELWWRGKRPFQSTPDYPAQLKEVYGPERNGWRNRIYWGDNLQVLSHLLTEFRGKIGLVYIDPPFDSKADYKKTIQLKSNRRTNGQSLFEEKQYGDLWSHDEYLQFMVERLAVLRELLDENGSIFVHCDWHRDHHLRCLLDEVFGAANLVNEITWRRKGGSALGAMNRLSSAADRILWYSKTANYTFHSVFSDPGAEYIDQQFKYVSLDGRRYMITVMRSPSPRPNLKYDYKGYKTPPNGWSVPIETMRKLDEQGRLHFPDSKDKQIYKKIYLDEYPGQLINDLWVDIPTLKGTNKEILKYPTQKPEGLMERILALASNPNEIVLDCFMGSGTTQAVAMKMGRRFIGADINLGAIQTTTKRLIRVGEALRASPEGSSEPEDTGFEVYILRDQSQPEFKRDAEAKVVIENNELVIERFSPINLLQKLSPMRENVEEWRELVESVMVDWNYDGAVLQPAVIDAPGKNVFVKGRYPIPEDAGTIRVKITDLLSESLEVEVAKA